MNHWAIQKTPSSTQVVLNGEPGKTWHQSTNRSLPASFRKNPSSTEHSRMVTVSPLRAVTSVTQIVSRAFFDAGCHVNDANPDNIGPLNGVVAIVVVVNGDITAVTGSLTMGATVAVFVVFGDDGGFSDSLRDFTEDGDNGAVLGWFLSRRATGCLGLAVGDVKDRLIFFEPGGRPRGRFSIAAMILACSTRQDVKNS